LKIDKDVEHATRRAFAGAVADEPAKFEAAMLALADRDEDFARDALVLGLAVDTVAWLSVHDGRRPDDEHLADLARAFNRQESWAEIDPGQILPFLTSLADHAPVQDGLPLGDLAILTFAVGGWLLSEFLPEGAAWTDFLDGILATLESAPAPG
jgi:hypothetical protein